ncbi:MAG: hypothetical protein GF313_17125, partial [Caldithrix sp.]|nr:hypothetical protein [Caldithrix sp.]
MIREIVTFMQSVGTEHFKEIMPEGIHIILKIDESGKLVSKDYEYYKR